MNKKHKLLHRDNEYITSKLEIIYEEDIQRIVEERNNLQSKIDKANNYIDDERKKIQQHQYSTGIRRLNKIQDILKEDK